VQGLRATTPRDVLTHFSDEARQGDVAALYALLPEAYRRLESLEAFRTRLMADRSELHALGESMAQSLRAGGPRAEVSLRDRSIVVLVDEGEGWRVGDPGVGGVPATRLEGLVGARAAVRALHAMLARQGMVGWRELLSARVLGATVADLEFLLAATEDPSALYANDYRTRVTFTLPDGRLLDVVYEQGAWRVDGLRNP
jgi:hypothetical protein